MNASELNIQLDTVAKDILKLARNILIVNLRFMDQAMSRLKWKDYDQTIATDGEYLYYNSVYILNSYKKQKELVAHSYLHAIFHCVFQHFFVDILHVDQNLWNLACDIAVEATILDLQLDCIKLKNDDARKDELQKLKLACKYLTAEHIYHYLKFGYVKQVKIDWLKELFQFDDHTPWYQAIAVTTISGASNDTVDDLASDWKNISQSMQIELEAFVKDRGDKAGNLIQNLETVNREKYDYTKFLKKFAVMNEAMKINDDEFDYIFYTYGLSLYKNMPLVEPLEYKDVKQIKEFVIAIDTSGSVSGELVQKFVQKTYNILKQEESFARKINLHIIQCDADIQEDVKITSQEEFDAYIKTMKIRGLGGTDFRPVFEYVEKLKKNKEFINLKGLIYFTDGIGVYPAYQPDYHTAFVFVDDDYNNYNVPVWAIKLILKSDEI